FFFFSSRRRHTRFSRDWSSDVCSSDLPVHLLSEGLFAEQEDAQKCRFEKEGECPLHCQCLCYDISCISGEACPIRSKLKLHRDTCDHAHDKGDSQNLRPEAC